jgi:hypothetical protein
MADFWSGKDSQVILMQDNDKVVVDVQGWNVKPNLVKAADGICGEDRDRLQSIINFYDLNIQGKQETLLAMTAFLDAQENLDAGVADLERGLFLRIQPLDGTSAAFGTRGQCTLDDWDFRADGRTERNQLNIPLRAQYFGPLATL